METELRINELDRLDLYDVRRRASSFIHNFIAQFDEYKERMKGYGFISEELENVINESYKILESIDKEIEVRRGNL